MALAPWLKAFAPLLMEALTDPAILERLQPAEFYQKWAEAYFPVRPDQRRLDEFRPLHVSRNTIGTVDSSSMVRIGQTSVMATVYAEVAEPDIAEPGAGFLVANVTLCSGCTLAVRAGPPTERAQSLTSLISSLLVSLGVVRLSELVVEAGNLVWCLHVNAYVISDCGNVFDACWIAVLSALRDLCLPAVAMNADSGAIMADPTRITRFSLPDAIPIPLSLCWLPQANVLIADPNDKEEAIMSDQALILVSSADYRTILFAKCNIAPQALLQSSLDSPAIALHLQHVARLLEPTV